jgi:hypothetical protein
LPELWHSIRKPDERRFYCIFIASSHPAKGDRIEQLQQQIEARQALLEKLAGNE